MLRAVYYTAPLFGKDKLSDWSREGRSYLKIRIFGRDQGAAENQPADILKYVEDLIRGLNADTCPPPADRTKRFFEMAYSKAKPLGVPLP